MLVEAMPSTSNDAGVAISPIVRPCGSKTVHVTGSASVVAYWPSQMLPSPSTMMRPHAGKVSGYGKSP
jgi:hypothetical protein